MLSAHFKQDRSVTNGRVLNAGDTTAVLNATNGADTTNPENNDLGTWSRANGSTGTTGNATQHPSGYTLAKVTMIQRQQIPLIVSI